MSKPVLAHESEPTQRSATRPRDIPALTVLRVFAAVLVVFSHHYIYWPWTGEFFNTWILPVVTRGDVGVKIFFILSGFILTHSYGHHARIDKRDFFLARFSRIYPMYLFGLFLALPILLLAQIPAHLSAHGALVGSVLVAGKCLLVLLLLQSWIPAASDHWNGVAWSLSTEAFFYALFPWLMPWIRGWKESTLWLVLLAGLVLETIRTGAVAHAAHQQAILLSFLPALRLADFVTGIAIGVFFGRGREIHPSWSLLGLGLLLAGALSASASAAGLAMMHVGSATLVASLASSRWTATNPVSRFAVLLGSASYGAYLIHQPLGYLTSTALEKFTGAKLPYPVYFALLLTASCLLFLHLETPARQWIKSRFSSSRKSAGPAAAPR